MSNQNEAILRLKTEDSTERLSDKGLVFGMLLLGGS